jgi:hypothetical protein
MSPPGRTLACQLGFEHDAPHACILQNAPILVTPSAALRGLETLHGDRNLKLLSLPLCDICDFHA